MLLNLKTNKNIPIRKCYIIKYVIIKIAINTIKFK